MADDPWAAFPIAQEAVRSSDPLAAFPISGSRAPLQITVTPQKSEAEQFVPHQPDSRPDIGRERAIVEGLRSGLTFNFGDELAGIAGAASTPNELRSPLSGPSNLISGLAQLGYEYLTGGDEAAKRYASARDEVRSAQKASEQQYPGTYLTSQIGGTVALPLGGLLNAPTMPMRIGRGAAVGAGAGALAGTGDGSTIEDRASRGLVGGVIGAGIGGAAVPAVEYGTRAITTALSRPIEIMRSAINPDAAAGRAVGRAYEGATRTDPNALNRLNPNDLVQGGPQTVLDTLGGQGRDLARSAANLSGEARDTLNATLNDRFTGQAGRLTRWLNTRFNFPNAHAQQQAIDQIEQQANRASYPRAYRHGDRPLWSPEMERLAGSPAVQSAMRAAVVSGQDRAINQGYGGFRSPISVTQDGQLQFNRGPNGVPTYPNLQFWDYTRREISDAASKAQRAGAKEEASRLGAIARALNAELDRLVPSYQQARAGAAAFFGAENALEAGQNFVTQNFAVPETRVALARMSNAQRQLFQDGFVSRLIETIDRAPDRADVVRNIYNSPAAREKIQLALGPRRATELEAMLRIENVMQAGLRAVQGNSTTTQQLAQLGLAGAAGGAVGAGGGGVLGYDPTISGIVGALAGAGKRGVDTRVAERIARMLVSSDPAVLNTGIQMIARNRSLMDSLRAADSAAARIGGSQSPNTALTIQAPVVGRTEDQ